MYGVYAFCTHSVLIFPKQSCRYLRKTPVNRKLLKMHDELRRNDLPNKKNFIRFHVASFFQSAEKL